MSDPQPLTAAATAAGHGQLPAPLRASVFYAECVKASQVWAVRDNDGFPVPQDGRGLRALPFWSGRRRLEELLSSAEVAYRGCRAVPVPLADWRALWLPGMARDGLLVGLNWSGASAGGCAVTPSDVLANLRTRNAPRSRATRTP